MLQKSTLCILCSILVWGPVGITHAGLVNGDFSDTTVTYGGKITYEQIGIGWIAKGSGNIPDWVIRNNQLDQVTKSGSKTRIGQVFDASDMKNAGWRLEFTLSGENLGRTGSAVVVFGGVDAGTNTPDQSVIGLGADTAPYSESGEWTQLVDLGETEAGYVSVEITQDLSDYDLIAIRFMSRSTEGDPILSISDLRFVASRRGLPPDGVVDVPLDVVLEWEADEPNRAVTYDVYFGTDFNDVSDADRSDPRLVLASQGQTTKTYDPGRLDFGQTYYWRIDEVNAPPDSTIFKGEVWSFTTEPIAYPIAGERITVTASSSALDQGAENTINGSGLDNDRHSTELTDMWLSDNTGPQPTWIQYEFDKVCKLHQMWVWNHNTLTEPVIGYGVREATIEYSADGINWAILDTTYEFARASGAADYEHNNTVDLEGVAAKYVKINANSNWGGIVPQYGLSEVRFLYIPVRATEPQPESGATDVDVDNVTLSWKAGREAAEHNVYISTDEQAVIDSNVPVSIVTEAQDGPISLDLGETYYWKVNEVNVAETPAMLEGDIWNFTARDSLVVEDFEDYNDYPGDRIYETWADGWEIPTNGAMLGYPEPLNYLAGEHILETTNVHGGKQSLPFFYDNSTAAYSEATVNIADLAIGSDWTGNGVKTLSLWFSSDVNNVPEQMYVKLNGVKVLYDGDAGNINKSSWQPWNIHLTDFAGVNLSNVTELSIGLERIGFSGGTGMVLFDDIRLYPFERQLITPADPGTVNLAGHWLFDEGSGTTAADSSGNNNHGTIIGAEWVAGQVGGALKFDGK